MASSAGFGSPRLAGVQLVADAMFRGAPTFAAAVGYAEDQLGFAVGDDVTPREASGFVRAFRAQAPTGEWDGDN